MPRVLMRGQMCKKHNTTLVWTRLDLGAVLWIGEPLGCTANNLLRLSVLTEREGAEQTRRMPKNTGSSLVTIS